MDANIKIVLILTFGFALASLLGYFSKRLRLPTMLGFLVAGYCIGPNSPGFVADMSTAEELAEIGVILMLFSVGLHFTFEDLFKVKKIAVPGAILQTTAATLVTILLTKQMGWSTQMGAILGLSIGVASTFVMARVLSDHKLLNTPQGHIAVGWLVVEDIFTVIVLVVLPLIALANQSMESSMAALAQCIGLVIAKFALLCVLAFTVGLKAVTYILRKVAQSRSQELFILTVLAVVFLIATISSFIFGTSLALGAFIAGMVIGKTHVKHHAATNSLPIREIFTIIFFLSIGMLLNPLVIKEHFWLFLGITGVIIIVKPLAAFLLVLAFRFPIKVALTIAFALAQIGEFSFILAEQATVLHLLPDSGYDIIVCCALLTICTNPLLFNSIDFFERLLHKVPLLRHVHKRQATIDTEEAPSTKDLAIIIGYGPLGQEAALFLQKLFYSPTVIEHNIDTVEKHTSNIRIVYGDASFEELLQEANIAQAKLLVITTTEIENIEHIVHYARECNPSIKILVKIQYLFDIPKVEKLQVDYICSEQVSTKALREMLASIC